MATLPTLRMAALRPGLSPPAVRMPTRRAFAIDPPPDRLSRGHRVCAGPIASPNWGTLEVCLVDRATGATRPRRGSAYRVRRPMFRTFDIRDHRHPPACIGLRSAE